MAKLAVLFDYAEENWTSMELVARKLVENCPESVKIQPPFYALTGHRTWDRAWNRYFRYPRFVRSVVDQYDFFHVADHSYAHLVRELPPERTGVFCHDLDAFRCLIEPEKVLRSYLFRQITKRLLHGLQSAKIVFHSTQAVRDEILKHQLVDPDKLIACPYGPEPEYEPNGERHQPGFPYLLHVGTTIPRKRPDRILEIFSEARRKRPDLHLIQVGGTWTDEHKEWIRKLNLENFIEQRRGVSRLDLAKIYRGTSCFLLASNAEGFGIPVIEALACGAPILLSDLPVLEEVAGNAAIYAHRERLADWVEKLEQILDGFAPPLAIRLERARLFSWHRYAQTIYQSYLNIPHV